MQMVAVVITKLWITGQKSGSVNNSLQRLDLGVIADWSLNKDVGKKKITIFP